MFKKNLMFHNINPEINPDKTKFHQRPKKSDVKFYHILTGAFRILPNFVIIGAQRCGTTSLYRYMTQNPYIIPSRRKEVHYFDFQYEKGANWYKAHFQTIFYKLSNTIRNCPFLTGEATPSYLHHPHASKRMYNTIPKVKLILLLRNPVDRAYSHHQIAVMNGVESLSFSEAIRTEDDWIANEYKKMCKDDRYYSYDYHRRSYLTRGIYINQIKNWLKYFSRDQLMIIKSEDFFISPEDIVKSVCEFLGIPFTKTDTSVIYNQYRSNPMSDEDRGWLIDYFKRYNEMLFELLGKDLGWNC